MGDKELLNRARNDKSAKESELSHRESCQQGCPVSLYRVYAEFFLLTCLQRNSKWRSKYDAMVGPSPGLVDVP